MTAVRPPGDERFPKAERLLRRRDFVRVQASDQRFRTKRLVVVWAPSAEGRTRVGFTVSKKVGNSPVRSLVKRRLREVYRLNKLAWPPETDFVVIARPAAADAGYAKLRADLLRWASIATRELASGTKESMVHGHAAPQSGAKEPEEQP